MDDHELESYTPQEAYREGRKAALRDVEALFDEHIAEMRRRRWPNMNRGASMFREFFVKRFGKEAKW